MNNFSKRVVIITGGGGGIGLGIAKAYAEKGSKVVITGRTEETLKKAKDILEDEYDAEVLYIVADNSDEEQVKNAIEKTIDKFGRIDVLINNAQATQTGTELKDYEKEDFDMNVNSGLYGTFFMMREAYPYLKESEGSVINFASGAGITGTEGESAYAATKEGIRGLSRVGATEWGKDNININIICPLAITELTEGWKEAYPESYEETLASIPLGRLADPKEDIGNLCLFLSSEEANYITGQTIEMQGGLNLRA